jgi:hypothetical protein
MTKALPSRLVIALYKNFFIVRFVGIYLVNHSFSVLCKSQNHFLNRFTRIVRRILKTMRVVMGK